MFYRLCRGRLKFKLYALIVIFAVISACSYLFPQFSFYPIAPVTLPPNALHGRTSRHLSKLITVVFRQFEDFENDVADSVQSFVSAFPNMPVLIVCENTPYPPFPFSATNETLRNVKVLPLELKLDASPQDLNPLSHILTQFVLFVPDSVRVSRKVLQQAATAAAAVPSQAVAVAVGSAHLICQQVKWNYVDWTLQYNKDAGKLCDAVHGPHALLIKTSLLQTLPQPFTQPFPEALYLQTTVKNVKVQILDGKLASGRSVLKSPGAKQRVARRVRDYRVALYKQLGVKALLREDGRVQWFGCKRETQRCYPSVQGTPSYVLSGRHTPPCCRRNLRRVSAHVLRVLLQAGARCWLETTSLLGAVMRNDILPWSEYIEVGIQASDVSRVSWLGRGGTDADGFVWERATRGHYYRVAFSPANRVYVLVLPFIAKNGTMWPADWVLSHQKEFPERHLHPLAQIHFAGHQAPAPNDARAFLDHKLGAGAVERCSHLGPKLLYP
ncbi:ribitol 5-phosphate transferase FKRP [Plodia interpunctella]|uniref:ribitol 5-phosphate transferase FKRP n=1 Tax=Plodia interpunctella TaxID=58824 RepID=UPI002368B521|nr:ribitol 5-phosphate transferase FKRP [Plodia interpunctella]